MDSLARLKDIDLPLTKYVRKARTKRLIESPEWAIEVLTDMMDLVSDGWDGNKSGNYKVNHVSSARVSLANMVRAHDLDWGQVFRYINQTPVLMEAWDNMNKARAALLAGEIIEIADEPAEDMVQAVDKKTRIDVRKWMAERDDRTSFGQRTYIENVVSLEINKIADLKARKQVAEAFVEAEYTILEEVSVVVAEDRQEDRQENG